MHAVHLLAFALVPHFGQLLKVLADFSISLDMNVLFDNANTIVTALWPVIGIGAGFTLGLGIMAMVLSVISKAIKSAF